MAKSGITNIGGGGADLDFVTAVDGHILAGTVGADKEGEPDSGAMPDLRKPTKIRYWRNNNNRLEVAVDYGLHGCSWVDNRYEYLEFSDLGIEPWKFRSDTSIAGVQGSIPNRGGHHYNSTGPVGVYNDYLYSRSPYGYYGPGGDDNFEVQIPLSRVRAVTGVEPWKFRSDTSIAGVQGSIPVLSPNVPGTDRVWAKDISVWAGTINLMVHNGRYLKGVNWVQYDIPNFQPHYIKEGVNIGGLVGTMKDYSYLAVGQTSF